MSSYAKLKELAMKRAEEEQAALNRERELKEKDAAAKRAAREAHEREAREREKKILVQKMARQKEDEQREKARREEALRLKHAKIEDEAASASATGSSTSTAARLAPRKKSKASGSTKKIDISGYNDSSSKPSQSASRRKRKAEQDDFVGNRYDPDDRSRPSSSSSSQRERASTSSSSPRKKSVPLTREEKQAARRAREFGVLPRISSLSRSASNSALSPRASSGNGDHDSESARRGGPRAKLGGDPGLVALGTKKRDHRTIDEIERDLRRLKEAKGEGRSGGPTAAELEREAALLRRQKAMEEKRRADQRAKDEAAKRASQGGEKKQGDDDDDLFGSDSDMEKKTVAAKATPSLQKDRATALQLASVKDRNGSGSASGPDRGVARNGERSLPSIPRTELPSFSRAGGINPADFLPGAAIRPEAMARLAHKVKKASASPGSTPPPPAASRKSDNATDNSTKRGKDVKTKNGTAATDPGPASTAPKRETARDRFIREQEAKKQAGAAKTNGNGDVAGARPSGRPSSGRAREDAYSSEYSSQDPDEYDSYDDEDDEEDDAGGASNYREEIWKIFGKDRKAYASRVVDSDDDMEADAESLLREEMQSAKQARQEDLREEQLERERERQKALRKKRG
ncbi:SPT2-domain-containing protein [Testicularia cyperi]|uniref:SPT2-domain-containing protein n=1 Tax=Testicularia cyperi TaxID=1882483 RepID=A0A317XT78_9BASI|nr:SPT2-domain-containing protein [Testicularia cyperi]